jgi:hypothetical protein
MLYMNISMSCVIPSAERTYQKRPVSTTLMNPTFSRPWLLRRELSSLLFSVTHHYESPIFHNGFKNYVFTNIYDSSVDLKFLVRQHKNRYDAIILSFLLKDDWKAAFCIGAHAVSIRVPCILAFWMILVVPLTALWKYTYVMTNFMKILTYKYFEDL